MAADGAKPTNLKHELRTPLNHIIGYTEMLIEDADDQEESLLVPDLKRIHTAGRNLLTVMNDLFDPTKEGKMTESTLHHEVRTPLNQIIGYAEMLQEESQEQGLDHVSADIQKIITAARKLLQMVVEHFVPANFGPGSTKPAGESQSTFFTRKKTAHPTAQTVATKTEPGAGRLLVVDDNDLNRDMLERRLKRLGYDVASAANGREALERIDAEAYDLVLLDILMPEMNGYEVLEKIRSNPAHKNLPVIVISASDRTENVAHCIELGAEDYLSKPFDPVILQARISASLEKKQLRDREASHLRQIEEEKKRSDELLHVILPSDVAAELKSTHGVKPRRFESVAVLFCDIAGFTAYCNRHEPETVLKQLQGLVESFELLTLQHELEKIKTIGDSFMATAGLLTHAEHPALNCARCGLAMIAVADTLPPHWKVRIGIHQGPVIAGVVGHRKYQYDIWGDTVNIAARMESAATEGGICVNRDTWALLEPFCTGESKGRIGIKGKGEQELYQVTGIRD